MFRSILAIALMSLLAFAQEVKDPNPPSGIGGTPRGTGGPDGYGYTWNDGVPFQWVDISGTGTAVGGGDDSGFPVTLGAPFDFYGATYSALAMATNGYLSTDTADTGPDLSNDCPLPATPSTPGGTTGARIYPLHDDLISTNMYYQYFASPPRPSSQPGGDDAGCSIFQWSGVTHFGGGGPFEFEVIIYHASGEIVYQIGAGNPELGSGSTTGIQSPAPAPAFGLTYACDSASSLPDNTAISFINPDYVPITIPTMGQYGMIAFLILLAIVSLYFIRRQRLA